jgi:hypothetical protein
VIRQVMRSRSLVGGVLLTGTSIITSRSASGRDVVTIDIPGIGPLTNPVVLVGRDLHQE